MEPTNVLCASGTFIVANNVSPVQEGCKKRTWKKAFSVVTLEPAAFAYSLSMAFAFVTAQNLLLMKVCSVNLSYKPFVCALIVYRHTGWLKEQEIAVQRTTAGIEAWTSAVQHVIPLIAILFAGTWADKYGRKKLIVLALVGNVLRYLGLILMVKFWDMPAEVTAFVYIIVPAIFGVGIVFSMAVFSYIALITTTEQRTSRVGAMVISIGGGTWLGAATSGVAFKLIGFSGVFGIAAGLNVLSLIYVIARMSETKPTLEEHRNCGVDLFDIRAMWNSFKTAFRSRSGDKRLVVVLMMLVSLAIGANQGEINPLYLAVLYRFGWNELDYSIYSSFKTLIPLIGAVVSLWLFSRKMKMTDEALGLLGSISPLASALINALAQVGWVMFIPILLDFMIATTTIVQRSIISKAVEQNEISQVLSFFGVIEAAVPLIFTPLCSWIYSLTIDSLPGAFHFLTFAAHVPAAGVFLWLITHRRRLRKYEEIPDTSDQREQGNIRCPGVECTGQRNSKSSICDETTYLLET